MMVPDLAFSVKVFAAMFAIMNPIANIPVFLSLTEERSNAEKRRIAAVAFVSVQQSHQQKYDCTLSPSQIPLELPKMGKSRR